MPHKGKKGNPYPPSKGHPKPKKKKGKASTPRKK